MIVATKLSVLCNIKQRGVGSIYLKDSVKVTDLSISAEGVGSIEANALMDILLSLEKNLLEDSFQANQCIFLQTMSKNNFYLINFHSNYLSPFSLCIFQQLFLSVCYISYPKVIINLSLGNNIFYLLTFFI